MHRILPTFLLAASFAFAATPAVADIANGSFDAPAPLATARVLPAGSIDIPGWEVAGGDVTWLSGGADDPAADGRTFIELTEGMLRQGIATLPGTWYRLDVAIEGDAGAGLEVRVNGAVLGTVRGSGGPRAAWTDRSFRFPAGGSLITLELAGAPGNPGVVRVDHVRLVGLARATPSANPTWGQLKQAWR